MERLDNCPCCGAPVTVLTDGNVEIGAYKFADREKPCLCIAEGNEIIVYGHFNTFEGAEEFMERLGKLVGTRIDEGADNNGKNKKED